MSRSSEQNIQPKSEAGQPGVPGQPGGPKPAPVPSGLKAISPSAFGYEQARHLLWRAAFGGTPKQIQTLASWGPERAVDYLLDYDKVSYEHPAKDLFDKAIMRPPTDEERRMYAMAQRARDEDALAEARLRRQDMQRRDRQQIQDVQKWWLKRMVESPRPTEEKLSLFWHGHFATSYRTIENSYHMYLQNELFRTSAVGNFGTMLKGIIRDPAMIAYLNNNDSRKNKPNENLAREIMELFGLGIGNYTEKDIKEGARALTGYTFRDDEFYFDQRNHDNGTKSILGKTGPLNGEQFVDAILAQPACSYLISRKLYHFLVADLPPLEQSKAGDADIEPASRSVIREMATQLKGSDYELKPVLRRLLTSEHFYHPKFVNEQIKSPVTLVVGAVRSLDVPPRDLSLINDALNLMGQDIFFPPSVKGWDGGRSWINTSTLFVRQNIMAYMLTGKKPQGYDATADAQKYDPSPLLGELLQADATAAQDSAKVTDYMLRLTLGRSPEAARAQIEGFLKPFEGRIDRDVLVGALLLITAMPEYQLC
jgi:uncharacterized protein (DUF1800 family)